MAREKLEIGNKYQVLNMRPTMQELFIHLALGGIARRLCADNVWEYDRLRNNVFECASEENPEFGWWFCSSWDFNTKDIWHILREIPEDMRPKQKKSSVKAKPLKNKKLSTKVKAVAKASKVVAKKKPKK